MSDKKARSARRAAVALSGAAALLLSGCAETQLGAQVAKTIARSNDAAPAPAAAAANRSLADDPALAPEVFDATGLTIWDGAATLQGVWLAHPLAQRAQRVRVYNNENGLIVQGALFKRDPALSGPSILISSDAARGLGVTPGEPTELRIVALREGPGRIVREEPTPTPEVEAAAIETAALPAVAEAESQDEDAPETAAPAPASVDAAPPAPEAAPTPAVVPAPAPEPAEDVAAEPAPAPEPEATQSPSAPPPEIELAETQVAPPPKPSPAPSPRPVQSDGEPAATRAAPPLEAISPFAGRLEKGSYLQVGAFSIEPNARILVRKLIQRGQPAKYVVRQINGVEYSIVVVGPLQPAGLPTAKSAVIAEGIQDSVQVTF